jgi:DNA-binding NtrC family response regulator
VANVAPRDGSMKEVKDRMEADLIVEYLQRFHGNKKKVAEALGISRSYLYKRLAEINEQPDK